MTATTGCIPNTATVTGDALDPNPEDDKASAQVCVQPGPDPTFDLVVDKTASHSSVAVGQRVTYTVTVTNKGPDAAPEAKVTDTLNAPVRIVSVRTTQGSCTKTNPMSCQLGTIPAGGEVTITVVVKHRRAGKGQVNAASATGKGTDNNPDDNLDKTTVTVKKVALKLSKVASRSTVRAGETLSYRIRVRNPTKGEARNVKVCDRLPAGLSFMSSTPKAKRSGGQRCWTIKLLKAGKSRSYRVTVRVANGANGRKVNRATLSSRDARPATARRPVRVLGVATPVTG
jgi:uncharacterized repeat protein (TIGR01451 family)